MTFGARRRGADFLSGRTGCRRTNFGSVSGEVHLKLYTLCVVIIHGFLRVVVAGVLPSDRQGRTQMPGPKCMCTGTASSLAIGAAGHEETNHRQPPGVGIGMTMQAAGGGATTDEAAAKGRRHRHNALGGPRWWEIANSDTKSGEEMLGLVDALQFVQKWFIRNRKPDEKVIVGSSSCSNGLRLFIITEPTTQRTTTKAAGPRGHHISELSTKQPINGSV